MKTTKLKIPRIPIPPHTRARKKPKSGIYHPNTGKSKTLEPDRILRLKWRDRARYALRGGSSVRGTTAIRGRELPVPPPTARAPYAVTPRPGPGPGPAGRAGSPAPRPDSPDTGQRDSPTYVLLYVNSYY